MKKQLYLFLLIAGIISQANAQEIVPLSGNSTLERHVFELQKTLPSALRNGKQNLQKDDEACPVENPDEYYVFANETIAIPIEIDTTGLDTLPGSFTCLNCAQANFAIASVANDTLYYTATAGIDGAKETITVEFRNDKGARTRSYPIVVRRRGRVQNFLTAAVVPGGIESLPTNINGNLPGKIAVCEMFLDCEDNYEGEARNITLNADRSRIIYQASRFAGLDSVCVVLCDTFAVCDTFKFSFRIVNDTLQLPFMDDFSYPGPYPAASHWLDDFAFVNYDMAISPPSVGVVTFDGLDDEGQPYGGGYGESDFLTSKYINLQGVPDEVVLTYWLQRRGYGDRPEPADSMLLEFKDRHGKWNFVRSFAGIPTFLGDVNEPFRFFADTIPEQFKHAGFQFRFTNFSERTGLLDVWHLDYVRLDNNFRDSIFNDIAFTRQASFLLKNYTSMPWQHFKARPLEELVDGIDVGIWNLNNKELPAAPSRARLFETVSNTWIFRVGLFNGEQSNIPNGMPIDRSYLFVNDPNEFPKTAGDTLSMIMTGPAFDNFDSLSFRLEYTLTNTGQQSTPGYKESVERNDGVRRFTTFDNYFSYDDATAEAGFIAQAGVQVAMEFTANVEDSLRAIQFHFPHTTIDVSDQEFNLKVWIGELDDTPEYEQFFLRPIYTDLVFDTLQGFTTYILVNRNNEAEALYLPPGKFYVGWEQVTPCSGTKCIPIGYDRNTPQGKQFMYRNLRGNEWESFGTDPDLSFFPAGALMIRPVVGSVTPPPTTSVDDLARQVNNFRIFPNPARSVVNIQPLQGYYEDFHYQLFSTTGQLFQQDVLQSQLDVSNLPAGLYFLKIADRQTNQVWNERFIIAK